MVSIDFIVLSSLSYHIISSQSSHLLCKSLSLPFPSSERGRGVLLSSSYRQNVPYQPISNFKIRDKGREHKGKTHDVILSIRSVVSFKLTVNNSCAMAGASSRNVFHCSFRRHHTIQSCSALTVAVRRVSLKKGNSPHGRPATISSKYRPWGSSYSARSIPDSNR